MTERKRDLPETEPRKADDRDPMLATVRVERAGWCERERVREEGRRRGATRRTSRLTQSRRRASTGSECAATDESGGVRGREPKTERAIRRGGQRRGAAMGEDVEEEGKTHLSADLRRAAPVQMSLPRRGRERDGRERDGRERDGRDRVQRDSRPE